MLNKLPEAAEVRGTVFLSGASPDQDRLSIQYSDRSNELHEVRLPISEAMYLLGLLSAMQRDYRWPIPPYRGPTS